MEEKREFVTKSVYEIMINYINARVGEEISRTTLICAVIEGRMLSSYHYKNGTLNKKHNITIDCYRNMLTKCKYLKITQKGGRYLILKKIDILSSSKLRKLYDNSFFRYWDEMNKG